MAFKLPKSPFNLNGGGDKKTKAKPKAFIDPGMPEDFTPIAPGTSEIIGTPYEGRAFVGKTGADQRQPVGKSVEGFSTERAGLLGEKNVYVAGVVQPRSVVGSSQDGIIKGAATIVKPYGSKRVGVKKRK